MVEAFKYTEAVTRALEQSTASRDNDTTLMAVVLRDQLGIDLERMPAIELLRKMYAGELPHFESIRRTRQMIQRERPELQGAMRKERLERARAIAAAEMERKAEQALIVEQGRDA